ncbi:MAG: hypothetical protein ACREQY_12635, partial [Candidatus Binatia bacterium]
LVTNQDVVRNVRRSAERERAVVHDTEIPILGPAGRMQENEDLSYLNRFWQLERTPPPASGGRFLRLRAWLKGQAFGVVDSVLARYFREERDFLENLVRVQNELARRIDELAHEVRTVGLATHRFAGAFRETFADLRERDEMLRMLLERRLAELEARKET